MLRRTNASASKATSYARASRCRTRHQQPFGTYSQRTAAKSRPTLPTVFIPTSSPTIARRFASSGNRWFRHEAKAVARYTITIWGLAAAAVVIGLCVNEEVLERYYPTPHEWKYMTRKYLRDANNYLNPQNGEVNWARALELSRGVIIRLEDVKLDGQAVEKLSDKGDDTLEVPGEFIACNITNKSQDWRRGYFEAMMLAAKAAEHVDGWVRDTTRNVVSPPQYVIGPSNPKPTPVPAGDPKAPREEDCVAAYPDADNWYMKLLATVGISPREKIEAALAYASFLEFKSRLEEAEAFYALALSEASRNLDQSKLPFDPRTFTLHEKADSPSTNVLDSITAIANFKARKGDLSSALPIYLSLLRARQSLSNERPKAVKKATNVPIHTKLINLVSQPPYPVPQSDGFQAPWRSPEEQCQEASLHLYIGEILYASKSREDGVSWTRDGVDQAEEQLRGLKVIDKTPTTEKTCRECLGTGLENWSVMVSNLALAEKRKAQAGNKQGGMFSFFGGAEEVEGRWAAEEAVVAQRIRRTRELLEEIKPPNYLLSNWLKA